MGKVTVVQSAMPDCSLSGSPRAVVLMVTTISICSFGHGIHTLAAVFRSTQSYTVVGTVK